MLGRRVVVGRERRGISCRLRAATETDAEIIYLVEAQRCPTIFRSRSDIQEE